MDGSKPYLQGPATLRSNFRNRTSNLRWSVLYVVGCRAAKTPSDEMTAPKKIHLFTYDVACRVDLDLDLVSHNVAG